MSDDIVNWLRKGGLQGHNEAADEIERLIAELAAAKIEIEKQRARVNKWVNAAMRNEEYDDDGR